jgi:hypothetical protein
MYPLQMNYPTPMHWRWRHQLLLSIVLACLPPSQVIYQSFFGDEFNFVASNNFSVGDSSSWTFLASWYLLLFSTTFIAAMQHSGSIVTVRNTMGAMLLDLSMALRAWVTRYAAAICAIYGGYGCFCSAKPRFLLVASLALSCFDHPFILPP